MRSLSQHFKRIFTLDLRALAIMRIAIALIVITDLCIRMTDLEAHYTNAGVLPLDALFRHTWNPYKISFHNISGLWQVQLILFLLAIYFALCLLVGYKTRLMSLLSWVMILSLHNRNPLILQGGDELLRITLFWGMFLPWGNFYSLDSLKEQHDPEKKTWFGMASVGYVLLVFSLYVFSALLKNSSEWHGEGTAIYYALSLDQMVLAPGKLIYNYPVLLKYLTLAVYYTELIVPFLLFFPVYTSTFRTVAIIILASLHLGIASTLFVGLFFLIGIATLLGMLPSFIMEKFDKELRYVFRFLIIENRELSIPRIIPKTKVLTRETALGIIVIYSLLWNWQNTDLSNFKLRDFTVAKAGVMLGINQNWGMFAPRVFKDDGWYIVEATTFSGKKIDLNRNGRAVDYRKPEDCVALYKNDRWRKYGENYLFISNNFMRPYYCDFIRNKWNREHPKQQIKDLKVIYMKEVTKPNYKTGPAIKQVLAEGNYE